MPVLPGLGSRSCTEINKALVGAERPAPTGPPTFRLAYPPSSVGGWASGEMAVGGEAGRVLGHGSQGAPPGFSPSMVGQPATQSGLCCSELAWEFGGSLLGSPWEPQGLGGATLCWWQACPILRRLGRPALKWKRSHLFFPFRWMFLSPSPREKQQAWAGQGGAQAQGSTCTPWPSFLSGPASKGHAAPLFPSLPLPPSFLPEGEAVLSAHAGMCHGQETISQQGKGRNSHLYDRAGPLSTFSPLFLKNPWPLSVQCTRPKARFTISAELELASTFL